MYDLFLPAQGSELGERACVNRCKILQFPCTIINSGQFRKEERPDGFFFYPKG